MLVKFRMCAWLFPVLKEGAWCVTFDCQMLVHQFHQFQSIHLCTDLNPEHKGVTLPMLIKSVLNWANICFANLFGVFTEPEKSLVNIVDS